MTIPDRQSPHLNATFDKQHLNATFGVEAANNRTFEVNEEDSGAGSARSGGGVAVGTFTRRKMSDGVVPTTAGSRRFSSRESSQDGHLMDEDRFSSTSDSSASHRLNDVGDVQQLARMQEESKSISLLIQLLVPHT